MAEIDACDRFRRARRPAAAALLARSLPDLFAADPGRFDRFHAELDDLLYDFSKQRLDAETLAALLRLAEAANVAAKRDAMFRGDPINSTERRAALHSALRNFSGEPVLVEGVDVMPAVEAERASTDLRLDLLPDHDEPTAAADTPGARRRHAGSQSCRTGGATNTNSGSTSDGSRSWRHRRHLRQVQSDLAADARQTRQRHR